MLTVNIKTNYVTSDSIIPLLPNFVVNKPLTKTYISCSNNCFSRSYGIYGLLEEFNAYSLEPRFLVDMYTFFDTCAYTNKPKFWEGYLDLIHNSWINFYYFQIFFTTYLKYIENNRTDFYEYLIDDISFKSAFTRIYSSYFNALKHLDCSKEKILAKINSNSKKYKFPYLEDFIELEALCEYKETQKYLSLLISN